MHLELPNDVVEAIAQRAAEIVLERSAPVEESPYFTVEEAAAFLRCRPQRIYNLRSDGRLSRLTDGGRALILRAECEKLVAPELPQAKGALRVA
jgi:hypothetical protein